MATKMKITTTNITKNVSSYYFEITLTEDHEYYKNNTITVDCKELERIGVLAQVVKALQNTLGSYLDKPIVIWPILQMHFLTADDFSPMKPQEIVDKIYLVANELNDNTKPEGKLPLKKAVSFYDYVPLLRAIAITKTEVRFMSSGAPQILPILDIFDFYEPGKTRTIQKSGPFKILGLIRSETYKIGHVLIITNEEIPVQLPADDPKWAWENIHNVLETENWLEGGIERDNCDVQWRPANNTRIKKIQGDLDLV